MPLIKTLLWPLIKVPSPWWVVLLSDSAFLAQNLWRNLYRKISCEGVCREATIWLVCESYRDIYSLHTAVLLSIYERRRIIYLVS